MESNQLVDNRGWIHDAGFILRIDGNNLVQFLGWPGSPRLDTMEINGVAKEPEDLAGCIHHIIESINFLSFEELVQFEPYVQQARRDQSDMLNKLSALTALTTPFVYKGQVISVRITPALRQTVEMSPEATIEYMKTIKQG